MPSTPILKKLVGGIGVEGFFESIFEKNILFTQNAFTRDECRDVLSVSDIGSLISETALFYPDIEIITKGRAI